MPGNILCIESTAVNKEVNTFLPSSFILCWKRKLNSKENVFHKHVSNEKITKQVKIIRYAEDGNNRNF
jgi:hypothetical protein